MADYKLYGFYTEEGVGKTGLTVTVDVYDSAGNSKVSGGAASEVAGGLYRYTFSSATPDDYLAVFKTADVTVDVKHVPAMVSKQQPKVDDIDTTVGELGDTIDTIDKKVSAFIDPNKYQISGAGSGSANGIYWKDDPYKYRLNGDSDTTAIERIEGVWTVYSQSYDEIVYYTATSNAETPDLVDNWELGAYGVLPLPKITPVTGVRLADTQGRVRFGQVKIIDNVSGEGALDIENTSTGGLGGVGIRAEGEFAGQYNAGSQTRTSTGQYNTGFFGVWNDGANIGQSNDGANIGQSNNGSHKNVEGFDPALSLEDTLTAIKGDGWTDETLVTIQSAIESLNTDTVMSFMIDGFTFEEIVQIMAAVLAGKLTRSGDTLTFRDLADTVNRVVAETDANKQRTAMTYTV